MLSNELRQQTLAAAEPLGSANALTPDVPADLQWEQVTSYTSPISTQQTDHTYACFPQQSRLCQILTPHKLSYMTNTVLAMFPFAVKYRFNPFCPDDWFTLCQEDEVMLDCVLYIINAYSNLMNQDARFLEVEQQKLDILSMISRRVCNTDHRIQDMSDGLFSAVAYLAFAEALRDDLQTWTYYMTMVKQATEYRGGTPALSSKLRHNLYRAGLAGAMAFIVDPLIPAYDEPRNFSTTYDALSSKAFSNEKESKFLAILDKLHLADDLVTTFTLLFSFSTTFSQTLSSSRPHLRTQTLDAIYLLRSGLLKYRPMKNVNLINTEGFMAIAGLLYLDTMFPELPFARGGTRLLLRRLQEAMSGIDLNDGSLKTVMIWALFIGAMCAVGENRIWLVACIHYTLKTIKVGTWEAVKTILESLCWVDGLHDRPCEGIWSEVCVLDRFSKAWNRESIV